ncbi:M14 family metallopeptidase [Novosphingobium album (ex Liu et al. 2023)]|uniref:M14 family metallopeptidase n=1 Tax=Novosphingobium album (ex Liu et al. 2023) TaxID=3031130 RepID=A0ABT5WR80_9SPHN|nr:M14 metallopeptidase family protein [Novosphingobium album (ex Liu et al. 2023)]MDE8652531.1 M14 family metallopeptidase [Novosphingobium album (ex Liu et al. 2023)]
MRKFLLATTMLAMTVTPLAPLPVAAQTAPATTAQITPPEAVFKAKPGSDYFLANYTQISAWLQTIAKQSDRMKLVSIGKTAEGREQYMAIVSSPENIRNLEHHRQIAQKLAWAKGLTDEQAHALAREGKAMVWIDAGLHASEIVNAQTHVQIIHEMLTGNDPETLRLLNDDIMLFAFANPDGLELVANWYMGPKDPKARTTDDLPVLYQKYVGHDNNRDSFAANQPETTNMNRASYREWFPQIIYNEHQTGPVGTVVFIPPFRDPFNYNYESLVINQTDMLGYSMHARLIAEGKPGSVMRSGAPYSTWFNGGVRTIGYFHNVLGILTEIIGNPTPMKIPLVPKNQLPRGDLAEPIAPQEWHFQQSIDYVKTMDRAVLDYASRYRETLLYNRYVMGRNQIAKGSEDSWIVTPKRIQALEQAGADSRAKNAGSPLDGLTGYNTRDIVDSGLYDTVLHDPAYRAPRAYIIPADSQPDMPTTVAFLNSLLKAGIEVQTADKPFTLDGKSYPAGSYIVRSDQAFRPHVLDMFEPQDHPQDFAYPGGPPVRPYDITGYTLAYQMNVKFDRILDTAPPQFPAVPDVIETPPAGRVIGTGKAGYVVSHATNNSFTLTNRLMKAGQQVYWLKSATTVDGEQMAPGALWIPASAKATAIIGDSVSPLGIDAHAVDARPAGEMIQLKPTRIGLVDIYGGSMASGWNRWLFDKYEFAYTKVFPQELDAGNLNKKYDVLIFQSDVFGRQGRGSRSQPAPASIPAEYRAMLGALTPEKTIPAVTAFARGGGTVIAVGDATTMGEKLGLPLRNALTTTDKDGKQVPLPDTKFYVPGSILATTVDIAQPLAYGLPANSDVFYYNSPAFTFAEGDPSLRRVAWYDKDDPLRSGWAWGQKTLKGTTAIVDASLGKGRVFLLAPEVTQRGQPYATFKYLFNGIYYGPSKAGDNGSDD